MGAKDVRVQERLRGRVQGIVKRKEGDDMLSLSCVLVNKNLVDFSGH